MSGILLLNNYFTYVDFVSALVTFVVAVFLAKLQVPCADSRWTPFNRMRWLMVGAYTALSVSNIMSALQPHEVETDILKAAVLIVGMVQALLFTAMCITFINPQKVSIRWGLYNCLAIGCAAALIVAGHSVGEWEFAAAVNISTALYIAELVVFSWKFFHTYTESKQCLESNYDEDLSSRLRWIKWCFISALGVGVMALLIVVFPIGDVEMCYFTVFYTLYYVYMGVHIVNYRITANFILKVMTDEEKSDTQHSEPAAAPEPAPHAIHEKTEAMKRALDKWVAHRRYVLNDQTIDDIAADLGFDRFFFAWYFTNELHTTFRTWRTELRIKEAQRLLSEEDAAVASLHLKVGISDKSNFYKHFKAHTGMTPTEYKKSAQK